MVRRVPIGTSGKMRLEFDIVNKDLLNSYVEFVRVKYERDLLLALKKKQGKKKSSSTVENLKFKVCKEFFINALSFLFYSAKQREDVKKEVEKTKLDQ